MPFPQSTAVDAGTVTLLFTDIVGSTLQLDRLSDAEAEEFRRSHVALLRDAVDGHGGRETKSMGDGLMVTFTSASQATACAVEMQQAIDRYNRQARETVRLRIGLHAGEPTPDDGDYFGRCVVIAKRLCEAASGGQIIVSDLIHALVGTRGRHAFRDLGRLALKGIGEPVPAFEVVWEPFTAAHIPLPAKIAAPEQTELVGRADCLARLEQSWQRALACRRHVVLVCGEPGIGKTRLASEFVRQTHAGGATTLLGHCFEETLIAYQPFVEALQHFVVSCRPRELRAHLGRYSGELIRLVPEVKDRVPDLVAPLGGDAEGQRYRLFEAVSALLASAARRAPVLLVVEDLHWADKPTLLLLKDLVRARDQVPMLIIGTYREVELGRGHPLAGALVDLRREQAVERVVVGGLSAGDVDALAQALAGRELPPRLAREVHDRTEGNPFFVSEIVRHLAESGALIEGSSGTLRNGHLIVPDGVKDVVGWRLGRLSEAARRVLSVAAVAGQEFGLDVLERAGDFHGDDLLDALDEAVRGSLIAEVPRAAGRYSFAHTLIREALYEDMTFTRRVRLHERIGRAVQDLVTREVDGRLDELAHHFCIAASGSGGSHEGVNLGGEPVRSTVDTAIEYASRAGDRAVRLLAHEEAVEHYRRALDVLEEHTRAVPATGSARGVKAFAGPVDARQVELLLKLGDASWNAGEIGAARETFFRAADVARRMGAAEHLGRAALGIGTRVARFQLYTLDETLVALLVEALAALDAGDSALRARVMACLTEVMTLSGLGDRKVELAHEAIAMARRCGDPAALADVLLRARYALWTPDNVEERLTTAAEIIRLDEETGDVDVALNAFEWRILDLLELGSFEEADRELETQARRAEELRQPVYLARAQLVCALRAIIEGRFDDAEALAAKALALTQNAPDAVVAQAYSAQAITLQWERGNLSDMEVPLRLTVEQYAKVPAWRTVLAWLYAELGREAEAGRELELVKAYGLRDLPYDMNWMLEMSHLTDVTTFVGDLPSVGILYELLSPHAERYMMLTSAAFFGSASRPLGMLAAKLRRWDEAFGHFEHAVVMNERIGARPWAARTRYHYARALLARGGTDDRHRATTLLSATASDAEALGMSVLAAQTRVVQRRLAS